MEKLSPMQAIRDAARTRRKARKALKEAEKSQGKGREERIAEAKQAVEIADRSYTNAQRGFDALGGRKTSK
ncbi:MAG: hypothetical protein GTO63_07960 [Anaerolineae bacterium]|nr:hypothetical protein [Anaerolineae bacterium]NIN94864.1 hypothetical protein [Anaerolineae bacterium]NIQ77915.1 hypothetical protein [Anaerolineae bacterium]